MSKALSTTTAGIALVIGALGLANGAIAQEALKFEIGADSKFHWDDLKAFDEMDLSGQTVSIFGPWLGVDKDNVDALFDYFEQATGATIDYAGSDSFEQQIVIDVEAGSPPNIAVFPQPGLAADIAAKGGLVPLGDDIAKWVQENYAAGESWVNLGTYDDPDGTPQYYGFFYKVDVKSLVWYSPDNFEDAGYEIPESMEDLIALSDQIVEDGGVPWCIGLGSGDATGWPATDWVEDLLLRTQSPDVYDGWVTNDIPFNDPRIVEAIETFGQFARNDAYVDGGMASVGAIDFRDSPKGLFAVPPKCYMHRQASFIPSFFPEDAEAGADFDFFYFPAYDGKDLGKPVLGAGTLWAVTEDSDATRAVLEYLKTPLANEIWMAQSGFLTPHNGVNTEAYADATLKKMGQILLDATTFRFDGSDLMPGAVGAGSFWTGMVDYAAGTSAEDAASAIQDSWESIK